MRYDLDGVCGAIHSTATVEACEVRFAAPPPWAKFLAELDRHQVWRLPDQSQLPADSMMVLDGWGFTAEVRNPAGYRRYRYDNPEAHRAPEAQDAGAIGRSLRLINGLVAPNVHRRTYRGLSVSAPGVQGFRPCDSTQVWEAGGDFRPISRLRPGYDTLALPVESLYVEVRGMLAAPGLAAQWRSRYPEVLDIDSVLHQEPWRNGRCAWGPAD